MQDQEGDVADVEKETLTSVQTSEIDDWKKYKDDDIMQQHSAIQAEQAVKIQFVEYFNGGDNCRNLYLREAEYHLGNSILLKKIKVLSEQYAAIRRTRGDGCFPQFHLLRDHVFQLKEHILESQIKMKFIALANVEECRRHFKFGLRRIHL
ncbi:hypothetical protein HAX54_046252 [Datura stramonium]|uniref:SPX domain-containing protein n=1 Tax=Datura stramonium TaxID=4076 RepID=A0ABS8SRL4_DATST|nr:hypothetical protein [Datura stramonium]